MPLRVLVVDDEPTLLNAFSRVLRQTCSVVATPSVDAAFELMRSEPFDVVISDCNLEDAVNGVRLLTWVRTKLPNARRILISGMQRADLGAHVNSGLVHEFLQKPVEAARLIDAVFQGATAR